MRPNQQPLRLAVTLALTAGMALMHVAPATAQASDPNPGGIDWQAIGQGSGSFQIARTETTVAQFRRFAQATGLVTRAERLGGGQVYEAGFVSKPGWTWRTPYGATRPAAPDEPAVHISYDEAQAFCRWAGGRLPSDEQWVRAAYTEQRAAPPAPWVQGRRYLYPVGDSPAGAQCLDECGSAAAARAVAAHAGLWRGAGHARTGSTPAGVNGLHDMGGNVWEWVDADQEDPPGGAGQAERAMRGGSWWYGAAQMQADHRQSKPAETSVVYIGFRCARAG